MKETPIVTLDEDDDDDDDAATVIFEQNGKDCGGKESDTISEVSKGEDVFKKIDNLLSLNSENHHKNKITVFEVSESDFENMEVCLSTKEKNTQAADTQTEKNLKRTKIHKTNETSKRFKKDIKYVSNMSENCNQGEDNAKTTEAQVDENQIKELNDENKGLKGANADSGKMESLVTLSDALQGEIDRFMGKLIDDQPTDGGSGTQEAVAANMDSKKDSSKDSIETKDSQIKTKDAAEAKEISSQNKPSAILKEDVHGYFRCNQCDYKGRNKSIVRYHVMNKHEGKTWDCSDCDYKGNFPQQLKNHKENNH